MLQIKKLVIGFAAEIILSAVLLLLAAIIVVKTGILPSGFASTLATAIAGASVFISAFIAARLAGECGWLYGLVLSGLYVLFYVGCILFAFPGFTWSSVLVRMLIFFLCGILGGILGVSKKEKIRF